MSLWKDKHVHVSWGLCAELSQTRCATYIYPHLHKRHSAKISLGGFCQVVCFVCMEGLWLLLTVLQSDDPMVMDHGNLVCAGLGWTICWFVKHRSSWSVAKTAERKKTYFYFSNFLWPFKPSGKIMKEKERVFEI